MGSIINVKKNWIKDEKIKTIENETKVKKTLQLFKTKKNLRKKNKIRNEK